MKFIHCADLHIDSKIERLPKDKSIIRREEVLNSFERLCDYAVKSQITAVIISGDMFDGKTPLKRSVDRVLHAISNANSVDFLYLNGNHDGSSYIFENVDNLPLNLKIFGEGFNKFRYGNVVVGALNSNEVITKSSYDLIDFNKEDFNILSMHGQVADYKGKQTSEVISLPQLRDKNIDYLALGHYHTFSVGEIDDRGIYAYSGCLDGRGFDEVGAKGFALIDTENKERLSFIEFSTRQYQVFNFNVSEFSDWLTAREQLISQIKGKIDAKNLVKVVLTGEHDTSFYIDVNELSNTLNNYFFFAKISDETFLKITQDDYLNDKTVRGEFVRLVWESDLSPEQKKTIISYGLSAIKGEEL